MLQKIKSWFKKKPEEYKEGEYFRPVAREEPHVYMGIELLKGKFKGIIYHYGPLTVGEEILIPETNTIGNRIGYQAEVLEGKDVTNDPEFQKIISQILKVIFDMVLKQQIEKNVEENLNEEVGESYFEEPVPKRTVSKKGSSVPKKRVSSGKKRKTGTRRNSKVRPPVQPDTDI
jgi:hypothetical protein